MITNTTPTPPSDDKLLLDAREVARRMSISPRTLWTLTKAGSLPFVPIGRRVLYRPEAIRIYLAGIERTAPALNGDTEA